MPSGAAADVAPLVSIVVPVYNRRGIVGATIDSVTAQSLTDWELVVFDDGSTDGSADVVEDLVSRDPRISVRRGPNGGVASARSRGVAATDPRSEFVIFLDSDDLWLPDTLEVLVAALRDRPDHVSAYGLASCIDADGNELPGDDLATRMRTRTEFRGGQLVEIGVDEPTTFAGLVHHNWVVTPGLHLIRRGVIDRVGLFDAAVDPADDWDFVLRISRLGPIGFVDRVVLRWRRHPATLTEQSPRWRQAYFAVCAKTLGDPANTAEQRTLTKLVYTRATSELVRSAGRALRRGEVGTAGKSLGRAAYHVFRYAGAVLSAWRRRRSVRPAPV
jgi:glycosyltransferase involved in cell wall biosynthesis